MTKAIDEFNEKVAELLKNSSPKDITEILKDEKSMVVTRHVNHNNNN